MLIEILTHTPLWVFGLFVLLIYLGWQQSRNRTVKSHVIFLLPIGMVALSYFGMLTSFGTAIMPMTLWLASLALTAIVLAKFFTAQGVNYDPTHGKYSINGSWIPLMLMMAIFFTKYTVGVLSALNPEMLHHQTFIVVCSVLYGGFSGIFIGRAYNIWCVGRKS
ncbi:DUF6622 family protein [Neptunicella sp. SCSIO 80796]|uniref:DUF6622 family protein n=1 Tax=Neptunicella plasticusilytica TaxID=3117012 RepID=UPI003A4D8014